MTFDVHEDADQIPMPMPISSVQFSSVVSRHDSIGPSIWVGRQLYRHANQADEGLAPIRLIKREGPAVVDETAACFPNLPNYHHEADLFLTIEM